MQCRRRLAKSSKAATVSATIGPIVFQKKITVGWPDLEGWLVSGKLHLRGPNPGDWWEYDRSGQVHGSYDKSWQETVLLTYPTGRWELLPADKSRLTDFVATWARRYI